MAKLKIVAKGPAPTDLEVYIDGKKHDDIVAVSFGASVDDVFLEAQVVYLIEETDVEVDGLEFKTIVGCQEGEEIVKCAECGTFVKKEK